LIALCLGVFEGERARQEETKKARVTPKILFFFWRQSIQNPK